MGRAYYCLLIRIYIFASCERSIFYLVSVAEQTVLSLTWSEILYTGFLAMRSLVSKYKRDQTWFSLH